MSLRQDVLAGNDWAGAEIILTYFPIHGKELLRLKIRK
jgi:hypothetical protein